MGRAKSWSATNPPCAQTTTVVKAQLCKELVLQHWAFGIITGIIIGIIILIISGMTFCYISVCTTQEWWAPVPEQAGSLGGTEAQTVSYN